MRSLLVGLAATGLLAQWPETIPERTQFARTSTVAEVRGFMEALRKRAPGLEPYRPAGAPRATETGKPLLAWRLKGTSPDALRVYVNANIHAGEVEGKEAIQQVVRELLQGKHPDLRRNLDLVVMPAYNADGTDALDPAIRPWQPNPSESGVGRRENAQGLDLNRDLMKAAAPNTRWLLAMLQDFDPAAVLDLHTTNGSTHGFHLTHGPACTLGADEGLLAFNRRMLVEVREELKAEGMPTYDYGNFAPYRPTPDKPPTAWETYDAHPRLLTNYPALRNRLAVLSESYVYRAWPDRISDTRRFVLACFRWMVAHRNEIRSELRQAQRRWSEGWANGQVSLPLSAKLKEVERYAFEWVDPIRDAKGRLVGEKSRTRLELPSFVGFEGQDFVPVPRGYLVDPAFAPAVLPLLRAHGVQVLEGRRRPKGLPLLFFQETARKLATSAYQGTFTLELRGAWKADLQPQKLQAAWTPADLDRALYVPMDQPLGRLAFYLLDPRSTDSLAFWGLFHPALLRGDGMWGEPPRFPILAVGGGESAPTGPHSLSAPLAQE
ncbi:M14 family zinc carboxypeptidase [Geothrix sp. 21YS21S-4]|uniref:M14 family zinc carboxypeptidase n=1 Tax=Geothrix sp. 21YS21S-4 TaxID=3068889 RepID=UPI0027B97DF9|nr:M14 family zinc carboxypeptidase [Geothrix sp. 21YS21S-4]